MAHRHGKIGKVHATDPPADMISSNDLRPGTSVEIDGAPYKVIDFLHVKPGKGAAFVRTKLKNMQTGNVVEKTFRAGETLPAATIEKVDMQYLYAEGDNLVFMDMETYEQAPISAAQIGSSVKYLKENMEVAILRWNGQIIDVELPNTVTLEVVETDPGVKGDTATGGTKPAKLETGAEVQVPLFIKVGERIRVDTRTDTYLGRE
ncbi:MAG: elongation factor P [Thermostichus sp. DG_1_6_bins_120]